MDMKTWLSLSTKEKIETYCDAILPILRENGIPKMPAVEKISALADDGSEEMRLQRVAELFHSSTVTRTRSATTSFEI